MWPSQCWGALQGSPRSLCLKQSPKCWALAFPLQTLQQQNAPTVLRTAYPPRNHHGYKMTSVTTDALFLLLVSTNVPSVVIPLPPSSSSWGFSMSYLCIPLLSKYGLIFVVVSLYLILSYIFSVNASGLCRCNICLNASRLINSSSVCFSTSLFFFFSQRMKIAVSATRRLISCKGCSQKSSRSCRLA